MAYRSCYMQVIETRTTSEPEACKAFCTAGDWRSGSVREFGLGPEPLDGRNQGMTDACILTIRAGSITTAYALARSGNNCMNYNFPPSCVAQSVGAGLNLSSFSRSERACSS